ncbi:MetQ/NlpA family ABC transporter substrate-binding protein, partial [Escherichia coli]|uniref:MetQ/NlpA family ABC transporter substrate-binding protein n=1 Tax=Escherichia coli TaxID=562 RepID=UPI00207CD4EB
LEVVKPIAAKRGVDIQIVEFSDYVVPNAALDAGEIQANSFQHQPYLDNQKTDRKYKIETVALTVNF